jgi:ssDNA-binding Zn-finger/Zn-ribbon topoisomerase 1
MNLSEYYRLKAQYENKISRQRKAIIGDKTLSKAEKKSRLAKISVPCPKCKKPGGLRFTREGDKLKVACAASPACRYSETVDQGTSYSANIREEAESLPTAVRNLENDVIRAKLDLLFGFTGRRDTVSRFKKLRPSLKELTDRLDTVRSKYWKTVTRGPEQKRIRETMGEMALAKEQLQGVISESTDATPVDARKAATIYVDTLAPLAERLRSLKYTESKIEADEETGMKHLHLEPYTLQQLIVPMERPIRVESE